MFLEINEKKNFETWETVFIDRSISTKILTPFWDFVAKFIPRSVAPNIISLLGLLCVLHAYYLCYRYMEIYPRQISIISMCLVFAYQTLDAVDGKHARKISNSSPLGELFDHACDNIGVVFVSLTLCSVLGIKNLQSQWYVVQISQIMSLVTHIDAFGDGIIDFGMFTGPGEAIFLVMSAMAIRGTIGWDWLRDLFAYTVVPLAEPINFLDTSDSTQLFAQMVQYLYYGSIMYLIFKVMLLSPKHNTTKNSFYFCLLLRCVPAILLMLNLSNTLTIADIISDGLFMSILTTDIILAKMANRELHMFIVVFCVISLFNFFANLVMVFIYYAAIFWDISDYMNLPVFSVYTNVYVDGVYDMCHIGHHNLFKNALKFGNRLFVGVLSDNSVSDYKRKPIMNMDERCAVVGGLSTVYKVIPNAPYPGIPESFIQKHNIHVVCHSVEYDTSNDIYYSTPRKLGLTRVLPRTQGISTSELIRRMKNFHRQS